MTNIKIETDSDVCNALKEELGGYRAFPASLAAAPDPVRKVTDVELAVWEFIRELRYQGLIVSREAFAAVEKMKAALAAPQPLSNPLGLGTREACAKIASDTGFLARQAVRSAKGPRDRSKALGAEEAAQTIRTAILSLPAEGGAREAKHPIPGPDGDCIRPECNIADGGCRCSVSRPHSHTPEAK